MPPSRCWVPGGDDKRRARLNIIEHLLGQIPYKDVPRKKVKLPKRHVSQGRKPANHAIKVVPDAH